MFKGRSYQVQRPHLLDPANGVQMSGYQSPEPSKQLDYTKKLLILRDSILSSLLESQNILLKEFAGAVKASKTFSNTILPISWLTIRAKCGHSASELLGITPFGKAFYDSEQTSHGRYGIDVKKGAVTVLRPDGWIATAENLSADASRELETYLKSVFLT